MLEFYIEPIRQSLIGKTIDKIMIMGHIFTSVGLDEQENRCVKYSNEEECLRKQIAKKSYDVENFSTDTKRTVHPKVIFSSYFNKLKGKDCWSAWDGKSAYTSKPLKTNSSLEEGSNQVKKFMKNFEEYKNLYDYTYNGFKEKVQAHIRKLFNIRK